MPSLTITTRRRASGARFVVRYRVGGRAWPLVHAGSFRTLREAKARRDLIAGEIAAGRDPALLLRALTAAPPPVLTLERWGERYVASRLDVDSNTTKNYTSSLRKAAEHFHARDVKMLTPDDVAGYVADLAEKHKPGTVHQHLIALRLVLDYAGADPNPARDPRVKLPKHVREEPSPPPAEHVLAILERVTDRFRLILIVIEQGALRLGEAVHLRWGDVNCAGLRLRLPRSATKRDRSRWVYLPEWLMDAIEQTCPVEDRTPERRVFQGLSEAAVYQAMRRGCAAAGIPSYSPHDLRHLRITVWHQSGVPARELAERAGHARPSMSLDVYSHVMPADEVDSERFSALLGD